MLSLVSTQLVLAYESSLAWPVFADNQISNGAILWVEYVLWRLYCSFESPWTVLVAVILSTIHNSVKYFVVCCSGFRRRILMPWNALDHRHLHIVREGSCFRFMEIHWCSEDDCGEAVVRDWFVSCDSHCLQMQAKLFTGCWSVLFKYFVCSAASVEPFQRDVGQS